MRSSFIYFALVSVLILLCALSARAVTFEWDPSPDADIPGKVIGYRLDYAAGNFTVEPTNGLPPIAPFRLVMGDQTQAVVADLIPGFTYYFAVVALGTNNTESPYSNVATFTVPGEPPTSSGDTNSPSGSGAETNSTAVSLLGILPRLWLYPTNGQAMLAVSGAVGATFAIQCSTNPALVGSWTTITNLRLKVAAPNANPNPLTTLEKAFVPALEVFQDPAPIDGALRYYRICMPLGYPILANQVLSYQEIASRLVAVRLPGINTYIVCYVTPEAAYLDYNSKTYIVKLESSGPNIREIADKVASTIGQNWTTASEFTVTDEGAKILFATVVQTDDPSTDPLPGVPRASSSDIIIDF